MKKIKKLILLTFLALLIGGGIFVYLNFGHWAKMQAEKIATNALGVKVSISSLDISLKEKKATVKGIRIANPPGFKKAHSIKIDAVSVSLREASRELIDFSNIQVSGTDVNLEVTEKGTNLQALKKLASSKKKEKTAGPIKVIVRKMTIGQSEVNPSVTLLNTDIGTIKVPPVRISGIGTKSNGVLAKEAVSQILLQYVRAAEREATKAGAYGGLKGAVDGAVNDVKKKLKGLF